MASPNILKLETNIPQTIALAFSEGKPVTSHFTGEQIMYSLTDGRRFYCAPFVAEKIKAAGVSARMPFEICKRQIGKSIQFEISTHNQTKAAGVHPAALSNTSSNQPTLNPNTNTFEFPAPAPPQYTPAQQAIIDRKVPQPPQPGEVFAPSSPSMVNRILAAFVIAFDVVGKLQEVSDQRGLALNWIECEHVRAIAATAFICHQKEGK